MLCGARRQHRRRRPQCTPISFASQVASSYTFQLLKRTARAVGARSYLELAGLAFGQTSELWCELSRFFFSDGASVVYQIILGDGLLAGARKVLACSSSAR